MRFCGMVYSFFYVYDTDTPYPHYNDNTAHRGTVYILLASSVPTMVVIRDGTEKRVALSVRHEDRHTQIHTRARVYKNK